jgi:hypothetical protein
MTSEPKARPALLVVAWLWVLVPFGYGLWQLIPTARQLFAH